jgi:hypothetical protein
LLEVVSLPEIITVKISSEGVESIAMSPVVVQQMPAAELVGMMLGVTGKDAVRVRELLLRGSLVAGGSRFRWQGFEAEIEDVTGVLRSYPDADPARPFDSGRCFQIVLRGGARPLTVEREAGEKKRMFRNRSFWDELMEIAAGPAYVDYSYKERADVYRVQLNYEQQTKLGEAGKLLAYSTFEQHVRAGGITQIELYTRR